MRTELKEEIVSDSPGFGAGEGTTELYIYKCPCGSGKNIKIAVEKTRNKKEDSN